ncbi:MAG: DUF502 domain-containing protein [Elusimicrobiota bacterium]
MSKIISKIRNQFVTGVIVILPLGLTIWIVWFLFKFIGDRFLPLFQDYTFLANLPAGIQILISGIITIAIIWFIGFWAKNFIGRFILGSLEKIVLKTPVVSKIYKTIRQITDTMFVNRTAFKKVAMIEYPRKGIKTMVFVTNDIQINNGDNLISVFVPSTPNPTTGFCILLPEKEVEILPVDINQAMEFIFSGGILVPENLKFSKFNGKKNKVKSNKDEKKEE